MARPKKADTEREENTTREREPRKMTREEKLEAKRKNRVVINQHRSKLTLPEGFKEEGWVYRYVNDAGTRIHDRVKAGWEFVEAPEGVDVGEDLTTGGNTDAGSKIRILVGTKEHGAALFAYLMRIEEELYSEDQEAKQQRVQAVEDQITGQTKSAEEAKRDGSNQYGSAKISHGKYTA